MKPATDARLLDDRYQLLHVVGRGAMAEVHAAEDVRLNRRVAVKVLHASVASQPELRARFEAEARAAGRISDPHVVAVYDVGEIDGLPYIVMELLSGRTVADELATGPMPEARVVGFTRDVLRAVSAAHAAGVIHRDIKPANMLLADHGVKVADFGIAKVADGRDLTSAGVLLGTPAYLAPERVAGGDASRASDLYSVGVVAYEALAGRPPFDGPTPLAVCHAIVTEDPAPIRERVPSVSPQLAAVVTRAMARDPSERFQTADQMLAALDEATEEPTVTHLPPTARIHVPATIAMPATRAPAPGAPARPRDRGRTVIVGAAVLVAVLLLVGVLLPRAGARRTPAGPAPTRPSTGTTIPSPLAHALDRLRQSIEP